MEVETPVLGRYGAMDPAIASFRIARADAGPRWLQTSPEYAMKRLLAAGSGPIFQIARAFREDERGPRHQPEFSLLEWYRPGFDHHRLMDEVDDLVTETLGCGVPGRVEYEQAFRILAGVSIDADSTSSLREKARAFGADAKTVCALDRDGCLDLLLTHAVQPRLHELGRTRAVHLYDYPASQAALARTRAVEGGGERAERFELFVDGIELANGYHELTDPAEQRRRFESESRRRRAAGRPAMEMDERLLAALRFGLPRCAGVALGLDRLVMLALDLTSIDEAMAFPNDVA